MPTDHRAVLHLGAQKTGTTAVQAWCRDHAADLLDGGLAIRTTQPQIRAALNGYEVIDAEKTERLSQFIRMSFCDTGMSRLFYSCESNAGPAFGSRAEPSLYPRADANFAGIAAATADLDRRVVFTVREYGQLIESGYVQRIKQGRAEDFASFLGSLGRQLSWLPVVESLVRHFGAPNVIVYDYQADRSADLPLMGRLLTDAFDYLEIKADVAAETWGRISNTRYTQRMMEVSLAGLPHLISDQERAGFKRFVERLDPTDPPASFLTEEQSERWRARYAADLDRINDLVEVR